MRPPSAKSRKSLAFQDIDLGGPAMDQQFVDGDRVCIRIPGEIAQWDMA